MPRKGKKGRGSFVALAFASLAVLSVILYISGGVGVIKSDPKRKDEIAQNVQMIYDMEHAPVVDLDEEAKRLFKEKLDARGGNLIDDMAAEQEKILAITDGNKADFARWFADAAIVGDSLTHSAVEFKWISEPPVYAKIGIRALPDLPLLDEIEAASPSVIFLCFGMNDLDNYGAKVETFAKRYSALIQRLQNSLPEATIYVNAVFPIAENAVKKNARYQYRGLYNETLQELCKELGVYYIDSGFILEQLPQLFEPDGLHMKSKFYPRWLTYLADLSGLSRDDE